MHVSRMHHSRGADRFKGKPSALICFGDSLSDSGNALHDEKAGWKSVFYPTRRFSDGKVWLEYLAEDLGLSLKPSRRGGHNYAFGGAESGVGTDLVPGVQTQVRQYLKRVHERADPFALYVIWVGGNDVKNRIVPFDLWSNIETSVRRLAKAGARSFLIPNLPSLGQAPALELIASPLNRVVNFVRRRSGPEEIKIEDYIKPLVSEAVRHYNEELLRRLTILERELGVTILHPDMFSLLADVSAEPEKYGLEHSREVFCHDAFHPSTRAHRIVASSALALLRKRK